MGSVHVLKRSGNSFPHLAPHTSHLATLGVRCTVDSRVVPPPSSPGGGMVVPSTFTQTSVLLSFRSKTTSFSVFVYWVCDPVDSCVSSDCFVVGAGRQFTNERSE